MFALSSRQVVACLRIAGAPFVGELPRSGIGVPSLASESLCVVELRKRSKQSNAALLQSLAEDKRSHELHAAVLEDARLGRMTHPEKLEDVNLDDIRLVVSWSGARGLCLGHFCSRLAPRFAVEQMRTDGSVKIRPIDHFSWSELSARPKGQRVSSKAAKSMSVNGAACILCLIVCCSCVALRHL